MKRLFDAVDTCGVQIVWNAVDVRLHDMDSKNPWATWLSKGGERHLRRDFIAGCDDRHGVYRVHTPGDALKTFERVCPFGWLGVRADVVSVEHELIYANHEHGVAPASMRSRTRTRYHLECALDELIEDWSDGRFRGELCLRLGPKTAAKLARRPSLGQAIAPLQPSASEPLRWERLLLAGQASTAGRCVSRDDARDEAPLDPQFIGFSRAAASAKGRGWAASGGSKLCSKGQRYDVLRSMSANR